jgi:hypothetical protein
VIEIGGVFEEKFIGAVREVESALSRLMVVEGLFVAKAIRRGHRAELRLPSRMAEASKVRPSLALRVSVSFWETDR